MTAIEQLIKVYEEYIIEHPSQKQIYENIIKNIKRFLSIEKEERIKFAQYHVEQALEAAVDSIECYPSEQQAILNSYPLDKIE